MLQRAAVLIGVKKTGGLPVLRAVRDGVEKMRKWAVSQPGMLDPEGVPRVVVLSDDDGTKVKTADVKEAIWRFVDDGTIEQLFVYFAGHGANVRHSEYWLLSGAPDDPDEAVNVKGSIPLARQCGIPHVVLISDACRTAAASIQSQAVQGSIVFPNKPGAKPGCVDEFYATLVGMPALEVSDPNVPDVFDAVYTTGLVNGLGGDVKTEIEEDGGQRVRRVKPWPLKRYLPPAISSLLAARRVGLSVTQTPDAIITSEPEMWLSQLDLAADAGDTEDGVRGQRGPGSRRRVTRGGRRSTEPTPEPEAETAAESLTTVSQRALRVALSGESAPATRGRSTGTRRVTRSRGASTETQLFTEVLERTGMELGPRHFESRCGFKVHGAAIDSVLAASGHVELLSGPEGLVRLWDVRPPATNTLIVFDDGCGALLPAIPEFIAVLTYEEGELANVTYEPSDNSNLWHDVAPVLPELRELRRVIAAAARLGVFRPETLEDQRELIDRFRRVKGLDPTMAVYAAYALHALQKRSEIEEIQRYLWQELQLTLFDIAMLTSDLGDAKRQKIEGVLPAVPLLSQGWALLDAYGMDLVGPLDSRALLRHLKSSLWTLFDERGVAVLRAAITSGEIE
ncbi:MAG TPA: hypothetical protein VLQ45_11215 [Thermoanaerobaculia bacterium]|nr:hypothetical protein [Thermoanaerobaculia bacterium]